jgi:hypothetical protein
MKSQISNHQYSFSPTDPSDSLKMININPQVEQFYIYDLTDNSFCISEISKTIGSDDCKIIWPNDYQTDECASININFSKPYWSGPCSHGLKSSYTDKTTVLRPLLISKKERTWTVIDTTTNQIFKKLQTITCIEKNNTTPQFEFFCYDNDLVKDRDYNLPIFSSTFKNISGFQGAFRFKDFVLNSVKNNVLRDVNFNMQSSDVRFLWIHDNKISNNLSSKDTLFWLQLTPTKNLKISESIFLANDLLLGSAILGDFSESKVALSFKVFERSVPTKDFYKQNINLYPNPTNGDKIYLTADFESKVNLSIYNTKGERLLNNEVSLSNGSNTFELPANIPNGIYIVRIKNDTTNWYKKLIIAK